jgi:hypothetical protein
MVLPRKQERRANRMEWLLNLRFLLKDKKIPIEKVYEWVNGAGKEWLSMKTLQRHRERLLWKKD